MVEAAAAGMTVANNLADQLLLHINPRSDSINSSGVVAKSAASSCTTDDVVKQPSMINGIRKRRVVAGSKRPAMAREMNSGGLVLRESSTTADFSHLCKPC